MRFYIRNIVGLLITIILVSIISFATFQILPGNPATVILGVDADPAQIEALEEELGVNLPVGERFINWVSNLFKGDLGVSYKYHQDVSSLISSAFEVTASLAILCLFITMLIGIPLGVLISKINNKTLYAVFSALSQVGISVPSFCVGILLINIFSVQLGILPSINYISYTVDVVGWLRSMIMPAFALAIPCISILMRYINLSINQEKRADYVRTAYSKGLTTNEVLYGHILRNSLIPVITMFAMLCADVLGGSIIIENVFSLPGIGKLIATSISSRDLMLIQGLVLYLAVIVAISNFVVDLLYSIADPRIKRN